MKKYIRTLKYQYYNSEIYDAFIEARKSNNFDNYLITKHSENKEKIKRFINNSGYDSNDFYIGLTKIELE